MKKRFVCCLLVISILLVAALPITADLEVTENGLPFTDVEAGKWYSDAVMYVYEKGIMEGKSDNTFAPNEGMTRAQIVTVFYRLAEAYEKGLGKRLEFSDVEKNAWYSDYLGWAVQEELVSGYPEGDFRPGASVSRQELAKLIVEFLGYVLAKPETDSDIGDFSDKDTFPVWSAEYIEELRGYGIVVGDQNGNFNPYNSVTRAEIAIIIQRIMPAVEEALKPLPPIMGWSSWNCLGIFDLSEEALIAQMDAMINLGLNGRWIRIYQYR